MINVLVLDRSRACLYETTRLGDRLTQVCVLVNPAARLPEHELGTDAPGRSFNRMSGSHQAYTQPKRFHSAAASRFMRDIGKLLDSTLAADDSAGVVLIASPRLLSELHRALPRFVRDKIVGEIGKDLAKHSPARIAQQLQMTRERRGFGVGSVSALSA